MRVQRTCPRGHAFTGEEPCPHCWPGYRTFTFTAPVWLYPGDTAQWHFISVPPDTSKLLEERFAGSARGWGSLRVRVTIGATSWDTSVFPDKKRGCYLLPLKADVRKREGIAVGATPAVTLDVQA